MNKQVITQLEQVTPDWLTEVLKQQDYLKQGKVIRLQEVNRYDMYGLSISLMVTYLNTVSKTLPSHFFLKMTKPETAPLNNREVIFYTQIAPLMPQSPAVDCYHAAYDPENGVYHLLLEDVSETHYTIPLALPPTRIQAEMMVDTLAKYHAFWWDHQALGKEIGSMSTEKSLRQWIQKAEKKFGWFVEFMGDRLSQARRRMYECAFESHLDLLLSRLQMGRNLTLVPGDVHVANFLFPHQTQTNRAYLIDWHTFDFEPQCWLGAADVAYMICHYWFAERRQVFEKEILKRYHQHLQENGVTDYTWDEFWYDYRLSAIISLYVPVLRSNRYNSWNWYPQV